MSRLTARTRPRKLAPRQNIQIVREDQVDSLTDFDSGRGPIETGVEKAEESVSWFTPASVFPLLPLLLFGHGCGLFGAPAATVAFVTCVLAFTHHNLNRH
jgi:hypothetical protein